jgi:hypothetical protein
MSIPPEAFRSILQEIESDPTLKEKHSGRSLTFGIINRRNQSSDYSRNNWLRASLYAKVLDFAEKYVGIPFDTISIGFGSRPQFGKLKNSKGQSFLVATGNFTGGELTVQDPDISGNSWSTGIFNSPVVCDFSKQQFKLEEYTGDRIVFIFYKFYCKKQKQLPKWDLREEKGEWVFYRGETKMGQKKKKKVSFYDGKMTITKGDILLSFD